MDITLADAGVVALLTALVQVIKGLGLKVEYAPVAAIVLGVLYYLSTTGIAADAVVTGIVTGLTSIGLYDIGGKSTLRTLGGK